MTLKRKVIVEYDRVKITATHIRKHWAWCELCRAESEFIGPAEAAEMARLLFAQDVNVTKEDFHFYQPPGEQMLICINSLASSDQLKIS